MSEPERIWDESGICLLTPDNLPCRFQVGDKVMANGSQCEVHGVYFGPGKVDYALVRDSDQYACMMASDKLEEVSLVL